MDRINPILFPFNKLGKFNEFMDKYQNRPRQSIYREIAKVKNDVSPDVINRYVKDIDLLSQMDGFADEDSRRKANQVKQILASSQRAVRRDSNVETQFCCGTSLLLWFLILVAIW